MKKRILITLLLILNISIYTQETELHISASSIDLTLNPFYTYTATEAQYLTGIYEGLVSYDPKDLSPTPAMAESWELSTDKKTYTFKIREGVTFSNGDKITAETFRNSFIKLLSPGTKAEFASLLDIVVNAREYRVGTITDSDKVGIKATEVNELVITLKKRAPYFTKILCHHSFTPIPPKLLDTKSWTFENQISSGPYILEKVESKLIFTKNNKYWDKQDVFFNKIIITLYDNPTEATNDFNKGKIDWMTEGTISLNSITDIESLKVNPLFGTTYYYFNSNYKEYKNPKIRKAINLLIPWKKIRENQYIPAHSLIPTLQNFPKNNIDTVQNVEKALKILEEEGYKKGNGLSDIILSVPDNTYSDNLIAKVIKQSIEDELNIKVIINKTPYPDFFTINRTNPFTMSTLSWIGDFADPLTFLEMWTSESNLNDSKYSNKKFDQLLENSSNLSKFERYKELGNAEKILLEDSIVMPISHSPGINAIDTRFIENWHPNTLNIHPFKHLKITEEQVVPGLI